MSKPVNCIMLVDDNKIDNFFHERVIKKSDAAKTIITTCSGQEALDYLGKEDSEMPQLIFLDINMPGMSGWEFIGHYKNAGIKNCMIVIMTGTPEDHREKALSLTQDISFEFKAKPLTKEAIEDVLNKFYSGKKS